MNTTTKRGKDLKVGDRVIADATGKTLTIKTLNRGIVPNSRLAQYKGDADWSTIANDHWYIIAAGPKKGAR